MTFQKANNAKLYFVQLRLDTVFYEGDWQL